MNRVTSIFAMLVLMWCSGCANFDSLYDKTIAQGAPAAGSVEGALDGTWQSQAGHGGDRLRAIVTKTGPDTYHIWFRATFWVFFHANQEVDLKASSVAGAAEIKATGEKDLGWLSGGVYQYEATLTPVKIDATYKSKYDHGEFHLSRPVSK